MSQLTRVSSGVRGTAGSAASGSAASAGGTAASGSGGGRGKASGKPAYAAPESDDDASDHGEFQVLDRVISPRKFAELQQAYTALGKMLNALPIMKRQ